MIYYKVEKDDGFFITKEKPSDLVDKIEAYDYFGALLDMLEELLEKGVDEEIYNDMWRVEKETEIDYIFKVKAIEKDIENIDSHCSEFNIGFAINSFIKEISIERESDKNNLIINYYISLEGYENNNRYETIIDLLHEILEDSLKSTAEQQIWRVDV